MKCVHGMMDGYIIIHHGLLELTGCQYLTISMMLFPVGAINGETRMFSGCPESGFKRHVFRYGRSYVDVFAFKWEHSLLELYTACL